MAKEECTHGLFAFPIPRPRLAFFLRRRLVMNALERVTCGEGTSIH